MKDTLSLEMLQIRAGVLARQLRENATSTAEQIRADLRRELNQITHIMREKDGKPPAGLTEREESIWWRGFSAGRDQDAVDAARYRSLNWVQTADALGPIFRADVRRTATWSNVGKSVDAAMAGKKGAP